MLCLAKLQEVFGILFALCWKSVSERMDRNDRKNRTFSRGTLKKCPLKSPSCRGCSLKVP